MKKLTAFLFAIMSVATIYAQDALWLRYPAISPDGKTIVFSTRATSTGCLQVVETPFRSPCMKRMIICRSGAGMANKSHLPATGMATLMCL
ncbi:MAG: hypothetical protein EOO04_17400 [Chitinophagaceae bacterium]|nr:MAG: hypothetical protein EOO04_17400 [Chitinophagaceae bacterium]